MIKYGKSWQPNKPKKLFPRLFGEGYLYIRCVYRSSVEPHKVKAYDYGYVRLVLPPLVAKIFGPVQVVRGNHTFFTLDASGSYDPDKKYLKTKGMSLIWFCEEDDRQGYNNGEEPAEGVPSTDRESSRSCFHMTGKLNDSSPVLRLNLQNVKGNRTYLFKIVIKKDSRTAQTTHKLRVEEPFVFSIR